jgi:glucose/arabinose dehydrogenase
MNLTPIFLSVLCIASAVAQTPSPTAKVQDLVKMHCAACHGENLDGGLGGSLIDGVWKRATGDQEIAAIIEHGISEVGMQSFREVLTPEQIRALVIYIRERESATRLAGMSSGSPKDGIHLSELASFRIERVATGLNIPWSITFLPDGRFLVAERPGALRFIDADGTVGKPIRGIPRIVHHGQGGLMEVALHPDFAKNGWIYLGYTAPHPNGSPNLVQTRVVRGRIRNNEWVDEETIWEAAPDTYSGAGVHFGIRFVFHEGYLWFGVGDRGQQQAAQDLSKPNGKIFRLYDDGRIPADNPFVKTPGALPEIWSYGHRNPQGLVCDPKTGAIYETEHGPRGGDELNLIEPGKNYGWPIVTFGMNYDGTPITSRTSAPGIQDPLLHWTPSIAACGLAIARGTQFPEWEGDLFAGGLASKQLRRIRLRKGAEPEQEILLRGLGRIRDVRFGPDGALYLVLNEPDLLVRLVPDSDSKSASLK